LAKINSVFDELNKVNSGKFFHKLKNNIWVAAYPKKEIDSNDSFISEDYFPIEKLK
jgi:hypothetical protein